MANASPDHVNLFVIGVNKAGTSWLYTLLQKHPDVFMSAQKELFYFGERYPEGRDEYHAHFPFDQSYRYFGEATPSGRARRTDANEGRALQRKKERLILLVGPFLAVLPKTLRKNRKAKVRRPTKATAPAFR